MFQSKTADHTARAALPHPTTAALLPAQWLPWLRVAWFAIALNAVLVFGWMLYWTREFADHPAPRVAEGLQALGWSSDLYFWYHATLMVPNFLIFAAVGCLIYYLRPNERMAYFASVFLIAFGADNTYPFAPEFFKGWSETLTVFRVLYVINNVFAWSFIAAFFALFPNGRFVPSWTRYVAVYVFFFSLMYGIFPAQFGAPEGWLLVVVLGSAAVIFGGSLYAQVWRFRQYATPTEKQQTKWLIYALALLVVVLLGFAVLFYLVFPLNAMSAAGSVAVELFYFGVNFVIVLLPISIGIAIVRYRLWDIDIIIRKTLTYGLVVALLALVYFGAVILLQRLVAALMPGGQNDLVTVISTLAIAALFVPLRNKVQELVDRRFYRQKYDAQRVLSDFANTVRDETDLDKLTGRLMQVVDETMQPKSVSVWLRRGVEGVRRDA